MKKLYGQKGDDYILLSMNVKEEKMSVMHFLGKTNCKIEMTCEGDFLIFPDGSKHSLPVTRLYDISDLYMIYRSWETNKSYGELYARIENELLNK